MLRIHFTVEDLVRTHIADEPDVMWEMALSLNLLQNREGAVAFDGWRRDTRPLLGGWVRPLITLAPDAAYFPDFLTPTEGSQDLEHGLDTLLSTPKRRLGSEMALLGADQRLPGWATRLAEGDPKILNGVGEAFRSYHEAAITPSWPQIRAQVGADRARRLRAFAQGGCEGLLNSFRPFMRWSPPVLEVNYTVSKDVYLAGRGLLLVPSYFCWRMPITLFDPNLPPVLVYPISHDRETVRAGRGSLATLLGHTRAAVLEAVEEGCNTTELSHRAGTSIASASQHAAVLREAGLIITRRQGGAVLHTLTPLGAALLTGGQATPDHP